MQFLWRYIDELVGKGLEVKTIAEFLLYTSATLVPMALPLSILMSSLMTFGNLGEKYELTAIKASGISLQRILNPLIIVVFFISIGAFLFANNVLPFANLQLRTLLYDIRNQRPEINIQQGAFNSLLDDYSIRVENKDPKTNMFYGVQIYDHSAGKGNNSVIIADSGSMKVTADKSNLILTLYNGHSYDELQNEKVIDRKKTYPHSYVKFKKRQTVIEMNGFDLERTNLDLYKNHYATMKVSQLDYMIDTVNTEIYERQARVSNQLVKKHLFKNRKSGQIAKRSSVSERRQAAMRKRLIEQQERTTQQRKKTRIKNTDDVDSHIKSVAPDKKDTLSKFKSTPKESDKESLITESHLKDSVIKEIEQDKDYTVIDIDSLYNLLTIKEQGQIAGTALNYARTAKSTIESSINILDYKIRELRRFEVEWHRKFTLSVACLLFLFIGAPLGAIIRKGGLGLPLVISVLFFILYYILSLTGDKMSRESVLPSYQGMWYTSVVFLITGAFITYQATTDSSILNLDTYINFIKKVFGQRYNIVDKISIDVEYAPASSAKLQKITSALINLQDNVESLKEWKKNNSRFSDVITSIFALQPDPNLIQFDRYYNNTFKIIINHPIFHNKNVRAKIYEFPSFNYTDLVDEKWRLVLRIVLACIPPLTLLVAGRLYLKMTLLDAKLNRISALMPELVTLLNISKTDN